MRGRPAARRRARPRSSCGSRARSATGLLGFYRSTYVDDDGRRARARARPSSRRRTPARAFPCFDEPEFKAVFAITLVVADGAARDLERPRGRARTAAATGACASASATRSRCRPTSSRGSSARSSSPSRSTPAASRCASRTCRARRTSRAFALDVGAFAIEFFADYYGIPYPGEKCDLVALPDFSFGAMENLGCVTFRETRLLARSRRRSTLDEMAGAALTIVHEVAHMWFGDLVTMKWWNGIWLNEAFATFMEHLGVDALPTRVADVGRLRARPRRRARRRRARRTPAPSSTRCARPKTPTACSTSLTYQKGGSVLRMLERWLGADAFRAGVRHYLDRYQLANTETTDLWDALEDGDRRARAPDHGLVDLPARLPELVASRRRRPGDDHAATVHVRRRRRGPSTWSIPVRARVARRRPRRDDARCCSTATSMTIDAPSGRARRARTRAARASTASRTRRSGATACSTRACSNRSNGSRSSTTAGPRCSRARRRAPTSSSTLARQLRDETDLVVWRVLVSVLRGVARLVEGDALAASAADGRAMLGADLRPARAGTPRPARTRARGSCAAS